MKDSAVAYDIPTAERSKHMKDNVCACGVIHTVVGEEQREEIPLCDYKANEMHKLCKQLFETYVAKNADYNDSFGKTIQKYGYVTACMRLNDKFTRAEGLLLSDEKPQVADESVQDTLIDLAAYALMTAVELRADAWEASGTMIAKDRYGMDVYVERKST